MSGQPDWSSPRLTAQVRYVVEDVLGEEERRVLHVASLLGAGTVQSLSECGLPDINLRQLKRISRAMPLFRVSGRYRRWRGRVPLPRESRRSYAGTSPARTTTLAGAEQSIVDDLSKPVGDPGTEVAARILTDEAIYSFVDLHAEALLELHAVEQVCALFERVPLARVMGDARLLLVWSDALLDIDEFEQAFARAKASRLLAGHAEQMECRSTDSPTPSMP